MTPARLCIVLLACAAWPLAHAQTIYRCGASYSQQPCPGAAQVDAAGPAPTAADRSQAATNAAREARLAEALEKDRIRRESQAARSAAVIPMTTVAEPEPHKWPEKAGTRKLDVFTATAPGTRPAKGKAKGPGKADAGNNGTAKTAGLGSKAAGAGAGKGKAPEPAKQGALRAPPIKTAKAGGA